MLQIVVIMFKCALCVIRRININTLHLPRIIRQQRLQRLQVVALDQHVFRVRVAERLDGFQQAIGRAAGGLQIFFAGKPSQRGHGVKRSVVLGVVGWKRLYANGYRLSKAPGARYAKSLAPDRPACRRGRKKHPKIRMKLPVTGQVRFLGQRLQTFGPPWQQRASLPPIMGVNFAQSSGKRLPPSREGTLATTVATGHHARSLARGSSANRSANREPGTKAAPTA